MQAEIFDAEKKFIGKITAVVIDKKDHGAYEVNGVWTEPVRISTGQEVIVVKEGVPVFRGQVVYPSSTYFRMIGERIKLEGG